MSINRGEIYFINLNPVLGREQAGKRPVLILSINEINNAPLVVTVIVGTKGSNITRNYPTNVRISPEESGLLMETVFMCFQIRCLDKQRFSTEPIGKLSEQKMQEIEVAIRYYLGL